MQHHPVEVGDLLIFSYDGVSMFNVRIYGKTFCEKNVKAAKSSSESNGNGNAAKRSDKLRRRRYGHAEKRRGKLLGYTHFYFSTAYMKVFDYVLFCTDFFFYCILIYQELMMKKKFSFHSNQRILLSTELWGQIHCMKW